MKAIGFFFAIFCSMLAVFLIATGEVSRWFSGPATSPIHVADITGEERRADGQNLLEFDFYDVNEGRRSFSIRAYLSQGDFHVESKIDQIRELTLKDGTLEVPLADPVRTDAKDVVPQAEDEAAKLARKVVLQFKSALYTRGDIGEDGKRDFIVLLREGKGVTDDGTEFFFDDLRFAREPKQAGGERKDGMAFLLTSDKPASIRGKALELSSPAGFEGVLEGSGIETFEFHPPVAALIDPQENSMLKIDPAVAIPPAASAEGSSTPGETAPPEAPAPGKGDGKTRAQKIAVTCQGPLSLTMGRRQRDAAQPQSPSTFIRFHKDVKLFTVDEGAAVDALPTSDGNRLECQYLEFELERNQDGLIPRRALATGAPAVASTSPAAPPAGGRLSIHLQKEGGAPYVIEDDRLEWVPRAQDPVSGVGERASEAILSPRPTLRGEGIELTAGRAALRLPENRLFLETIRGTIRREATTQKPPRKGKDEKPPIFSVDPPAGAATGPEGKERATEDTDARSASSLPSVWDVKADEAEFFFTEGSGLPGLPASAAAQESRGSTERQAHGKRGGGTPRDFSRLVARSRAPGGVEIRSRPEVSNATPGPREAPGPATASPDAERPFVVTGDVLTYVAAGKKATLEGSPARKPRFEQGSNWIESRTMSVHLEEGVAVFEEEVHGRLEDLKLARKAATGGEAAGAGRDAGTGTREKAGTEPAPEIKAIDVDSSFLALRFEEMKEVVDLLARGGTDRPLRVTAHSADDRWYRFIGPQLHWDQRAEVAQLFDLPADPASGQVRADQGESMPRLEYEGGDVRAGRIRFERKTWKGTLTDGVLLRVFPSGREKPAGTLPGPEGAPEVEISAGTAEIEFFPELERRGEPSGSLQGLSSVKSLRAERAPGELIKIKTPAFTGRTEELSWDSAARQLRFEGNGLQEIDVAREDFQGPITAKEIVFDEEKRLLILQGGVQGRLLQARIGPVSSVEPAALAPTRQLVWQFATNVLEVQLKEGPRGSGFELVSVRARDKVHLRNDDQGIQLLGDDLTYEEATRKVHVFSPDGRPQTLLCDRSTARRGLPPRASEAGTEEVHKVVAQEIWALLQDNPHALAATGEPKEWLIVSFHRDVIGSFHLPPPDGKRESEELGDVLKMVAERLTLYIDPAQPRNPNDPEASRRMIPWAVAVGNVDFSSGNLRATADRALFEEPFGRLTLFGSPARLSRENKRMFEDSEIAIRRVAGEMKFELIYKGPPRAQRAPLTDPLPDRR